MYVVCFSSQGVVMPKGANSIDMRRAAKGAIREGGAEARDGADGDSDDDDMDAYLEGYEEPAADEQDEQGP